MSIDRFVNEYSFLSNFYLSTISYDGCLWKSVEHAYQASKTLDNEQKKLIKNASTPVVAKRLGKLVHLREGFDKIKVSIMEELIHEKFQNVFLQHMLLQTKDEELIEGNNFNDVFWGVCRGVGENNLGKILMKERNKLNEQLSTRII